MSTNTKELVEIITDAIREEQYFSKQVLIPKIRALITAFRLDLRSTNYGKELNPSESAKMIRANELHNLEKDFWKQKLKTLVGADNMNLYYEQLDIERIKWGK